MRKHEAVPEDVKASIRAWRAEGVSWLQIQKRTGLSDDTVHRIGDPDFSKRRAAAQKLNKASSERRAVLLAERAMDECRRMAAPRPAPATEPVLTPSAHIIALHARGVRLTGIAALTRQPYRVVSDVIARHREAAR